MHRNLVIAFLIGICAHLGAADVSAANLFASVQVLTPPGQNFTVGSISGRFTVLGDGEHGQVFVFESADTLASSTLSQTVILQPTLLPGENLTTSDFGVAVQVLAVNASSAILAVGAPALDNKTGAVFIFKRNNSTSWTQVARLAASPVGIPGSFFGDALSFGSPSMLLVGAPGDGSTLAGAAYVFELINGTWVQVAMVTPNDTAIGDEFGISVSAANPSLFIVGAPNHGVNHTGAAYIFASSGNSTIFAEIVSLTPPRPTLDFGQQVAISSFVAAVISTPAISEVGFDQLHVYGRNNGGPNMWKIIQSFDFDGQRGPSGPGESLSLALNVIAVGVPQANLNTGVVLIFSTDSTTLATSTAPVFVVEKVITAPDARPTSRFGFSVQLDSTASQMVATSAESGYVFRNTAPSTSSGVTATETESSSVSASVSETITVSESGSTFTESISESVSHSISVSITEISSSVSESLTSVSESLTSISESSSVSLSVPPVVTGGVSTQTNTETEVISSASSVAGSLAFTALLAMLAL